MKALTSAIVMTGTILLGSSTAVLAQESTFPEMCASSKTPPAMHSEVDMASMKDYQREAMEGMQTMDRNMTQGMMKDDADVAFVCGMIAHHQGAIDMAQVELAHGGDKWAKETAQKIIDAQKKEIAEMTQWLKDNAK